MKDGRAWIAATAALFVAACGAPDDASLPKDDAGNTVGPPAPYSAPDAATAPVSSTCSPYGRLDRDGDGRVQRAEYDAFRSGVSSDWDEDNDDRISRAEFDACWNAGGWIDTPSVYNIDRVWRGFDVDADGFLTNDEFFGDDAFDVWDVDNDGALDLRDWQ